MKIVVVFLFFLSLSFAQNSSDTSLYALTNEIAALKKLKLEKLNVLEKKEATRWQNRYTQNSALQEYQNETRALESKYTKISDDISRFAGEVGATRTLAAEQKEKAENAQTAMDNFYAQIKQAIDKSREETELDFPAKMEERLLFLTQQSPNLETFFTDKFNRLALTKTQELTAKDKYRLRLGTAFFAEAGWGENSEVQAVLRTGSLNGKSFEWRDNLSAEFSNNVRRTILSAQQGENFAWVPIDVLQTKTINGTVAAGAEQTSAQQFIAWFKAGGLVMYPLALVALASLLIALERGFILWRRGHISKTFIGKLHTLIKNNDFAEAKILCEKQKNSLGNILGVIVGNSDKNEEDVKKKLQEAVLFEQSKLEKRMNFLAALGAIAPLLGLLGTVTGMILLFKVITEVGTNDARILAGGISEALITTETGLIIAIPVMLFHGKLSESLDYISTEIRLQSLSLLNSMLEEK
ncbi:hypothetical protein AGMMS49938_01450 [Fibrobacterales bacterium]|nr:hypothetical protein AGMMS49938_01450 [Fibrobacterales bacterium]